MGLIRIRGRPDIHVPTHPTALARRVPNFAEMRTRLADRSGHDLAVIDTFLDGRMTRVVQHIGDVYLAQIQGHIDTIVRLRDNVSRGIESGSTIPSPLTWGAETRSTTRFRKPPPSTSPGW